MKILIATPLYPPDIGGPATYTKFLEENLPKQDFELIILKFSEVRRWPYIIRHIIYFFKVLSLGRNADIIYALDALGAGVPAGLAAKMLRKRFFLRIAGDRAWETASQKFGITESLDTFSASSAYSFPVQCLKMGQKFGARLAEKIIVPSEYLKTVVSNWGVPKEKIRVIYNAFEPVFLGEPKAEIRKELSLEGTIILSSGRFVPWKGFEALIQAIPRLLREVPDAVLYIIGDGPGKDRLLELSYEFRKEGKVVLLPALPKKTLARYIKAADVFILNTFYEGFSHQLLEVMSIGTPLVTTVVGGNPELVESEKEGLLIQYNDREAILRAILRILREGGLSKKLSASAKEKVWQFSTAKAISSFIIECKS